MLEVAWLSVLDEAVGQSSWNVQEGCSIEKDDM